MLISACAAEVPGRWVTGDSVDGAAYALRRCIEKSGCGYVLAVTSRQRLGLKTVADWLEDGPTGTWRRRSAGAGAKGPAVIRLGLAARWLGCRRRLAEGAADPPQAGAA